jgi:hypothetical protein
MAIAVSLPTREEWYNSILAWHQRAIGAAMDALIMQALIPMGFVSTVPLVPIELLLTSGVQLLLMYVTR